ncbi:3-hydroxyacyl-CoA dehydrogenase [Pseudoduganella sp. LjRoot289]|uniref:3-hydroxyacyl-CoA dehydrogenase n=1 Tax=Pseudoduganella sp. LjRoot289 TaxID=3342314 RepID=UPI003F4F9B54
MPPAPRDTRTLGVAGAGAMGRGIAQVAAQAGIAVLLYDVQDGAAARAVATVREQFTALAAKGKLTREVADAASLKLGAAATLDALADCDIVIEAIVEQLEAKRALFDALEHIVSPSCVLATNTSSLAVTAIAAGAGLPGRIAGCHFFNPVPLMKVVEVIAGALTGSDATDALTALVKRIGHTPVQASDTPGFIVNHAGRGYLTEALKIVQETVADFAQVDAVLRGAAGFRLGPFQLLDLTGLDVSHPVMESIYRQYYQEPRYRPSPITAQRLAAGLLGKKTGRGFYGYAGGKPMPQPSAATIATAAIVPEAAAEAALTAPAAPAAAATAAAAAATAQPAPAPAAAPAAVASVGCAPSITGAATVMQSATMQQAWTAPIWIDAPDTGTHASLAALLRSLGADVETGLRPSDCAVCLVAPLGEDVSACVARLELDAGRTLGIDPLCTANASIAGTGPGSDIRPDSSPQAGTGSAPCVPLGAGHVTLMLNPATDIALAERVLALFEQGGQPATLIDDSAGFIVQRVLATIINIGCDIVQQSICTPQDLDSAVTLGLGYPRGPLAWGNHLGPRRVLAILQNLQRVTGDPRYRPSPWLVRRAQLGLPLHHVRGAVNQAAAPSCETP